MSKPDWQSLSRLVRAAQAEERLPSVSAAVFRGGDVVWSEAVGLADADGGEDVTPEHQYRVGSITKTFTAVAVMQLRDAGELDLDDRLEQHLGETRHGTLTLRRLLAHASGLQREPPGEVWESMVLPTREEILDGLGTAEAVLPPAEAWHYSNLGFALLGEVVARRARMPCERVITERIVEPLGLRRTTWNGEPPFAKGYFVDPYAERLLPEPFDVDLRGTAAVGGLWSTAGDLCLFGAFLCEPDVSVLAPASVDSMHVLQAMADPHGWSLGWGLGVGLFRRDGRILAGHDGGMPGHVAMLSYDRAARVGSAVLMATSAPAPAAAQLGLRMTAAAVELLAAEPVAWRPQEPPPAEVEPLLGRWWAEGQEYVFRYRDGRLQARWTHAPAEAPPAVFEADGTDRFRTVSGRERGELLRVVRDGSGGVEKMYWATYPLTRTPSVFG